MIQTPTKRDRGIDKQRFRGLNPKGEILSHPCLSPMSDLGRTCVGLLLLYQSTPIASFISHDSLMCLGHCPTPSIFDHHRILDSSGSVILILSRSYLAPNMSPCKFMNPVPPLCLCRPLRTPIFLRELRKRRYSI
jgi:hypothetical protein